MHSSKNLAMALAAFIFSMGCTDSTHEVGEKPVESTETLTTVDGGFQCQRDWDCEAGQYCVNQQCVASCSSPFAFSANPNTLLGIIPAGDGGFTMGPVYAQRLAFDATSDGLVDVVASPNPGNGTLTLFPGKGDGRFETEVVLPGPLETATFAHAVDFDGDLKTDIVLGTEREVVWLRATSSTSGVAFSAPAVLWNDGVKAGQLAQMIGNALPDLVLLSSDGKRLVLLEQNSAGTVQPALDLALNEKASSLVLADFNQDGLNDIVVAFDAANKVFAYLQTSNGFGPVTTYSTPSSPDFLSEADLDGDAFPELIFGSRGTTALVTMKNNGQGGFLSPVRTQGLTTLDGLKLYDVNRDGRPDALVYSQVASTGPMAGSVSAATVVALLGNGQGGFSSQPTTLTMPMTLWVYDTRGLLFADLNRDENVDLLANYMFGGHTFVAGSCR